MKKNAVLTLALTLWNAIFTAAAPTDVPSAASFFVPNIPDIHQDPEHPLTIFAGQISSDPKAKLASPTDVTAHLYFVLVKNRRVADKERVMFWFNGGPGCSSFDGLMMEVGPWRSDRKGGFVAQEGGWEEYTTMVYVDQPAGTGFSYTSTNHFVQTLEEAAEQFLEFLANFYKVFPEYERMETYLGGESYAGQYIPIFADAMLNSNLPVRLNGVAIGNGWIDARRQYPSYIDFAVRVGLIEENSDIWKEAHEKTNECITKLNSFITHEPISVGECDGLMGVVGRDHSKKVNGTDMCLNIYDVRLDDTSPACGMNWPVEISDITKYLDRKEVVNALHAADHSESWIECRPRIHMELRESRSNSSIIVLPRVLEKIPVLLFAGDQDLICNYVGQEAMINAMTWNGGTGLGTVQTQSWNVNGNPAGTWVSSRNLTYAKIFNASHMAPYDVPHVTHDMILRFMGMNFSAIMDGSARISSSVGSDVKPHFLESGEQTSPTPQPGKTPEQDKAMWEAYYNAGSAALVLVIIFIIIGSFLWFRNRRKNVFLRLPVNQTEEESIPLNPTNIDDEFRPRKGKGKERARDLDEEHVMFDVGDDGSEDDDEDEGREPRYKDKTHD